MKGPNPWEVMGAAAIVLFALIAPAVALFAFWKGVLGVESNYLAAVGVVVTLVLILLAVTVKPK